MCFCEEGSSTMPGKREVEDILGREKLNQLDLIFHPRSIAVVGVSEDENKIASLWLKSLASRGFKGELYAVNPKGGEIFGSKIWPSLSSIPGSVDLVIVCIPRSSVVDLLWECSGKAVRAGYFYTRSEEHTSELQSRLHLV